MLYADMPTLHGTAPHAVHQILQLISLLLSSPLPRTSSPVIVRLGSNGSIVMDALLQRWTPVHRPEAELFDKTLGFPLGLALVLAEPRVLIDPDAPPYALVPTHTHTNE